MSTMPSAPRAPEDPSPSPNRARPAGRDNGRWQRLLVLAGLFSLAFAQPLLDLLGNSPATFQINQIEGSEIVAFAVAIVVVPPLLAWLAVEAVNSIDERAGRLLFLVVVTILFGLVGLIAGKELTDGALTNGLLGLGAAGAGLAAFLRFDAFSSWIQVLSALNLLVVGQFVFVAPVSDWIRDGNQAAIDVGTTIDETAPSVVMLVFDEWPTQSILNSENEVDDVRFPNLAAFAEDSTWYRHFTTISPFTRSAVPSLLDGLDPMGEPHWTDHPNSLFSLLANSHDLLVSEVNTEICGLEACDGALTASAEDGRGWGPLVDLSWGAWTDRVRPGSDDGESAFDDFEEVLTSAPGEGANDQAPASDDDALALERFLSTQIDVQPSRHQAFVEGLQPTDNPFFGFLHLILPHQPWTIRETGTTYEVAADRENYGADSEEAWPVAVSRQRHLLQAEFADRLLGVVLDRLAEIDEYEDTLIVVTGDHGVALEPGEPSRRLTDDNIEPIAYTPLFVKAPGQDAAVVDDTNLNITDITPTVASMLGVDLPWATDGAPAGSAEIAERGTDKYIYSFTDAFEHEFLEIVEYDDAIAFDRMTLGRAAPIARGDNRIAALYRDLPGAESIGQSADAVFGPGGGSASVDALDRLEAPDIGSVLLGEVAGQVFGVATGSTVLVAVNDEIVGVSPLYTRAGQQDSFVILLPADALDSDGNTIRIASRSADGSVRELTVEAG